MSVVENTRLHVNSQDGAIINVINYTCVFHTINGALDNRIQTLKPNVITT